MSKIEISKLYKSFDHKNHFLKRTLPPLHFFYTPLSSLPTILHSFEFVSS